MLLPFRLIFFTASGIFKNDNAYKVTLLQVNLLILEQLVILIDAELL
nr:MAG TPA: hypothetical protein [Bacteriophage sp.]